MTTLRLGTYNLLNGGGDRFYAQAEFLGRQNLDVLCLQEAKRWDEDGHARMRAFADHLGMQALFAPSNSHRCHLVTLFRWPRVCCTSFRPDVAEGQFHHAVSRADLTVSGPEIQVLNTHLSPFSGSSRAREADWLTEYAAPGRRAVLAGELNVQGLADDERPDWDALPRHLHSRHRLQHSDGSYGGSDRLAMAKLVHAKFTDPVTALGIPVAHTAGYWNPTELWDHRSDHIRLAPGLACSLTRYEVLDTDRTRSLSDHLPVIVTLTLPQERRAACTRT
ncbi:endonuclease/exonuclease/phosphatase [Streptomyces griseoviridis]|uniref:endonuclease/exonuclease/phosphatase family protein n=1 Tax=Streptomyces griseoviridis TaxID=45398 RepID=UPI0034507950